MVISSFSEEKSLGLDGWTVEFFADFFDVVGVDVLRVVEEIQRLGEMPLILNSTFIVVVPKLDRSYSFDDFQPIAPCNSLCKIVAKIIAIRIKPILSNIISLEQFGFLKGRFIHEAIGLA